MKQTIFLIYIISILLACTEQNKSVYDLSQDLELSTEQSALLYLPESDAANQKLLIHFHGKSTVIHSAWQKADWPGPLCTIHLGPFSSAYRKGFLKTGEFQSLLTLIDEILSQNNRKTYSELCISSFSAGYGGVREILKNSRHYARIQGLVLADGLHADSEETLLKQQMSGFLKFAEDAVKGHKIMIISHSAIDPENYASTTETADYLLDKLTLHRQASHVRDEINLQTGICSEGNLEIISYHGSTGADHMKHLFHIDLLYKKMVAHLDTCVAI